MASPPDVANGRCLGAMFTAIVAAIDVPGRQKLADIVEYCHTRRALGLDSRALPVLFYQTRDQVLQHIATEHLAHIHANFPQCRLCGRLACPHCSHLYIQRCEHHMPLNDCHLLSEQYLLSIMDDDTRREYVRARYYGERHEIAEIGYRYLLHLANPDVNLDETMRQLPTMDSEDEERLIQAAADGDHSEDDFWDEEDLYSDFEDSFYSNISDITYESSAARHQRNYFEDDSRCEHEVVDTSPTHVAKPYTDDAMSQDLAPVQHATRGF